MSQGYLTDAVYPRHFHRETMPAWIAAVQAALGRRCPELRRPYAWLELGCGSGLNAVVAAATNPGGRFVGIDFNAEAIAQAQALADAIGVRNVRFHCVDFDRARDASADEIPECDFIVAHGVYSWIGPRARAAIHAIVERRLRPGGVFHVSYLSHPGSASFDSARRLMRLATRRVDGSSIDKMRAGHALLRRMAAAGAGYFQEYPDALDRDAAVDDAGAAFLAHEYLNEHRDVLHVADVMADLASVGCEFAGSAIPCENLPSASMPPGTLPLLEELRREGADAAIIETFKDVARNQTQRCDLYQRATPGGTLLDDAARRAACDAVRITLLPSAPMRPVSTTSTLTMTSRIGPVKLPMADVAPLLEALQDGPRSHAELVSLPAYARQPDFVGDALHLLAWSRWLQFLRPDHASGEDDAPTRETVRRLNAALARQAPPFNGPILAAAAIGSAIPLPPSSAKGDPRRLAWLGAFT